VITKIYADEQVRLLQHHSQGGVQGGRGSVGSAQDRRPPLQRQSAQDVEITASAINFLVAGGNRLSRAETSGPPQIALLPVDPQAGQTRVTADKFTAMFDASGQLSRVHGEAHAKVVTSNPPQKGIAQPDRVSTSDTIDGIFRAGTGTEAMVQEGHFAYSSGTQQAFADKAKYSPADQILVLTGSPRVLDSGMETTARDVRLNRALGEGYTEGDVKTTYNDMKPQPGGALLASSIRFM